MTGHDTLPGHEALEAVPVADAMHIGLISCSADAPVGVVAQRMSEEMVHCILVAPDPYSAADEWRVISDLDLIRSAESPDTPAFRVAASPLVTVTQEDSVLRAIRLMREYETAHLLVLSDGGPAGVISTFDVAGVVARLGYSDGAPSAR